MESARRTRVLAWALLGLWCVLVLRALQVQVFQHAYWEGEAEKMRKGITRIPAPRGEIRSADGQVLARSVLNWSLGVDPKMVKDPAAVASALDSLGLVHRDAFLSELAERRNKRFFWISREILTEESLNQILRRFDCLSVQTEGKRLYPFGRAGGAVVGLVGRDEVALGGLETTFDHELTGTDGKLQRISDATGKVFQGFEVHVLKEPQSGLDLETTIDSRLQEIASARLEEGVRREGAAAGFCILTRPSTGEILALVSTPSADPEDPSTWNAGTLKAHPVTDSFEPGSSFKLVAFSSVIDAGLFNPDEPINCYGGLRQVPGGKPIKDHEKFGVLKAWEVLAHSSNIGSGVLAERAGAERFYRMERSLGFGLETGIPLPGEGRGRIPEPSGPAWSARSLVTEAFGQEVSCTAIQMAMAYGAVANGGNLMRPLLVRAIRDASGRVVKHWEPEIVRPALRPSVAEEMRTLLRGVVTDGTGKKAEIPGLFPAGKTSTAQKYIPEEGGYSTRRYIASFVGFAPGQDPKILCLVLLDEPTSSIYGGNVAAPIFREVVSDAIPILEGESPAPLAGEPRVPEAQPRQDMRCEIPAVAGLSAALSDRLLRDAGFLVRLEGTGERAVATVPAAGEAALPGTVVSIELTGAGADSAGALMPDLRGLSLRDALLRVRSAGSRAEVTGTGWVLSQYPDPGTLLAAGATCRVTLGPDSCRAWKEYLESEQRAAWADAAGSLPGESPR